MLSKLLTNEDAANKKNAVKEDGMLKMKQIQFMDLAFKKTGGFQSNMFINKA